jgi:hypothetical protein
MFLSLKHRMFGTKYFVPNKDTYRPLTAIQINEISLYENDMFILYKELSLTR